MAWTYELTDEYYFGHMSTSAGNGGNALEVKSYLENAGGFSDAAIIGIISNMDHESSINPAQGEYHRNMSTQYGYGLVQWTPARTKIVAYAAEDELHRPWYSGSLQMEYLLVNAPATWIKSQAYPYSWEEYKQITDYNLATRVFFYNFERGTWSDDMDTYTNYWANTLYGDNPPTPDPPLPPTPVEEDELKWIAIYLSKMIR